MTKKSRYLTSIFLSLLILGVIFYQPLLTHTKIILFISEQFPQIPLKPLGLLTKQPLYQKVELESKNGKIVADLFVPQDSNQHGVVIIAMGVRTQQKDKPLILSFSQTLSRLGYIVMWPRLQSLDKGASLPEEAETFIESFKYLQSLCHPELVSGSNNDNCVINPDKISYVGFSVGSSTALIASTDPQIKDKVYSLVFFGGHYNVFDYLLSLATKTVDDGNTITSWKVSDDAIKHAKDLLKSKNAEEVIKIFDAKNLQDAQNILREAPEEEINGLKSYSPADVISNFKAKIFILHDKSDTYVPYIESVKLNQALSQKQDKVFLIIDLFEHVQPNRPINMSELAKLYGFLYQVLSFI